MTEEQFIEDILIELKLLEEKVLNYRHTFGDNNILVCINANLLSSIHNVECKIEIEKEIKD